MKSEPTLDKIYTADEAAERLKLTRRAVITTGKRYGLCFVRGREVRFTERHLVELVEAMRYKPSSTIEQRYVSAYEAGRSAERLSQLALKRNQEREERKRVRREQEIRARERREEEKQLATAAKREARIAAREERNRLATQREAERLDRNNRDPSYWTAERKEALRREREERVARMKDWQPKQD